MKKIDLYPFLRLVSSQRLQLLYDISLLSTAFKKSAVFQNFYRANRNALPEPILSMFNRKYGNEFFLFSIYLIKHQKRKKIVSFTAFAVNSCALILQQLIKPGAWIDICATYR